MSEKEIGNGELGNGKPEKDEAFKTCSDLLGKLDEINDIIAATLINLPAAPENRAVHLLEALERIGLHCPPKEPAAPVSALPEPQKCRYWLELPRGVVLQRFVNTKRETHFIGQYNDSDNKSNPNPRRVYKIDVVPMWDDDEGPVAKTKAFEVSVYEDAKLLVRLTTMRGRAIAERLGVKALKAWIEYLSRRNRHKIANRKACRARGEGAAEKQKKGEA